MEINHPETFWIGIFPQNEGCEGEVILYAGLPYICLNMAYKKLKVSRDRPRWSKGFQVG